jgi:hypothetical protein
MRLPSGWSGVATVWKTKELKTRYGVSRESTTSVVEAVSRRATGSRFSAKQNTVGTSLAGACESVGRGGRRLAPAETKHCGHESCWGMRERWEGRAEAREKKRKRKETHQQLREGAREVERARDAGAHPVHPLQLLHVEAPRVHVSPARRHLVRLARVPQVHQAVAQVPEKKKKNNKNAPGCRGGTCAAARTPPQTPPPHYDAPAF